MSADLKIRLVRRRRKEKVARRATSGTWQPLALPALETRAEFLSAPSEREHNLRQTRSFASGYLLLAASRRKSVSNHALGTTRQRVALLIAHLFLLPALALFLFAACAVEETRSGLPPEAQATIDRITEEIAAGQLDKIYAEAAEEWRQAATPEQSRQTLETLRARLGRVAARNFLTGRVQRNSGGELPGQSLVVTYQTKFEMGAGMETFTLVERNGQWLLARYFVNSDALR